MGISSADLAGITADGAQRGVEDLNVLVRWLTARVVEMEAKLDIKPEPCPELPSERSQRLSREFFAREQEEYRKRFQAQFPVHVGGRDELDR